MAVGTNASANHSNGAVLAETWNGTSWKPVNMKAPPGGVGSGLSGVSCVSAKSCIAVGSYFYYLPDEDTRTIAFSETWNGSAWSMTKMSQPTDSNAAPASVSCVSVQQCVGVGELLLPAKQTAFAETWNGATWKMTKVVEQAHSYSSFSGVSCPAATSCIAVDLYNPDALAESWDGKTWKILEVPASASSYPSLSGVSCLAANYCLATGGHLPSSTNQDKSALALSWNGRTWRAATLASPGTGFANLEAVSCSSVKACLAVGEYNYGVYVDSGKAYAASWDGTSWKLIKVPTPPGGGGNGSGSVLLNVDCLTATDCVALGEAGTAGVPGHGFSALWNGHGWRFIAIG